MVKKTGKRLTNEGCAQHWTFQDGKIVRCPVELGLRSGSEIEILSGIEENQLIVLKQTESLKTGQSVGLASPAM